MFTPDRQIVRILKVEDTREFIEEERGGRDVLVPVPGSGNVRECERCGREHEVHATVELDDGTTSVVGTGCAGSTEWTKKLRSAATRATAISKLKTEVALLAERAERSAKAWETARGMTPPEPTSSSFVVPSTGETQRVLHVGDASRWVHDGEQDVFGTIIMELNHVWRSLEATKLGHTPGAAEKLRAAQRRLDKRLAAQ